MNIETILDYAALCAVIWFMPHILMMMGLDNGNYWESYKGCGIALIAAVGIMLFSSLLILAFMRILA